MWIGSSIGLQAILLAYLLVCSGSFSVRSRQWTRGTRLHAMTNADGSVTIGNKLVTASILKNLELTDYEGKKRQVGSLTGEDKSVVVFLRHLG